MTVRFGIAFQTLRANPIEILLGAFAWPQRKIQGCVVPVASAHDVRFGGARIVARWPASDHLRTHSAAARWPALCSSRSAKIVNSSICRIGNFAMPPADPTAHIGCQP